MRHFCLTNAINFDIRDNYEKGHRENLNRIINGLHIVDSVGEFILHLEDDWTLIRKGCPIFAALDVMMTRKDVGHVCFGKESGREFNDSRNESAVTATGTQYKVIRPFDAQDRFCPFTLNPGVFRVEALRKTGLFEGQNFEYSYGSRWSALGWRTAHLVPGFLNHSGNGRSAYDLNGSQR